MNLEQSAALQSAPDAALSPTTAALIPLQHHEAFHSLKTDEQQRVSLLLSHFREIESAPEGKVAAIARIALESSERGFSKGNLKSLYYGWVAAGRDWRAVVRGYGHTSSLPNEFVEEVRRRCEANTRGARQAIIGLRHDWQNGASIPGYGTWREWFAGEFPTRDVPARWPLGLYPKGWSQSQLYTKQSSRAERVLKRRGFAAAKRYLPHVIRDRSALRPLELITIDDFETDQLVRARHPETGVMEICTCTGLLAIDVATMRRLAVGLKPRFRGEEGQRISITRADVQQLLFAVFSEHGLPRDYGCTLLVENAAAAISADFELALESLLGVQVSRTGLLHDKTLANGFVQGGGKPWEKGWIESTFNLFQNMAGALPGQKGASYQLKPGDLEAKLLYTEKLLSIEGLTSDQVAELHVDFLTHEEALTAYENIFARMEQRTDHRMQGFAEVVEYRLPDGSDTVNERALAERRLSRDELLACTPVPRRESSLERWARLTAGTCRVQIAPHALALLLLTPKQVELRNHKVSFVHQTQGFTFADADSPVMQLPEGTKLLAYFDAGRADLIYCTTMQGQYVGPVKRRGAVSITNRAAIAAEAGEITRLIAKCVINPLRARHAAENEKSLADDAHNLAKLREWRVPDSAIPARLVAPAKPILPPDQTANATALVSVTNQPAQAPAAQILSLSAKLGAAAEVTPAAYRSAGAAYAANRDALAAGIGGIEAKRTSDAEKNKALQGADDLDTSTLL